MKVVRRVIAIIAVLMLAAGLMACGGGGSSQTAAPAAAETAPAAAETVAAAAETAAAAAEEVAPAEETAAAAEAAVPAAEGSAPGAPAYAELQGNYMDLTYDEVQAKVKEMSKTAEWDDMVYEYGILDKVEKILEVEDDYVLRIGTPLVGRQDQPFIMVNFEAFIEASTNGKVQVENYFLNQLGTNNQTLEGVLDGSITGWSGPIEYLYNYAPGVGVTSIPFLFDGGSYQVVEICRQDSTLDDYMKSAGFWNIAWGYDNSQNLMTNKKVETLADFKGLKVQCKPSDMMQNMVKAFGATPVLMDSTEVSLAFQNGTIDASCSGVTFFNTFKVQENAKYMYKNFPFVPDPVVTVFSTEFMESLPEDLRDLIVYAGNLSTDLEYQFDTKEALGGAIDAVSAECEIIDPSEELITEAKEATASFAEDYCNMGPEYKELYDKMVELINKNHESGATYGEW